MSRYHRRGLRGFLDPVYTGSVNAGQVLLGAAVGTVGAALVKMGLNKITTKVDGVDQPLLAAKGMLGFLSPVVPLATASLAGTALYLVQKKNDMGRAHLVGAVGAGAAISVMDYLKTIKMKDANNVEYRPFEDYVMAPSYANYVMAPSYAGVIGNNPAQPFAPSYGVLGTNPMVSYDGVIGNNPRLAAVTASAMGAMDNDRDMMDAFSA
jgi:hypothetical protein